MTTYLVYVDDSGDEHLDLLAGLLVPIDAWTEALRLWLEFRRRLLHTYAIPISYELHASKFLHGRGRPSIVDDAPINTSRALRRHIGEDALALVATMPGVRVATVAQRGTNRNRTYRAFAAVLEDHLARIDGHAILIVDGDEHHPAYYGTHRDLKLADRRIIEDPWMQGSHVSQLIQAADLIAYSAFQHLSRRPGRQILWPWYEQHIAPLALPTGAGTDGVIWLPPAP